MMNRKQRKEIIEKLAQLVNVDQDQDVNDAEGEHLTPAERAMLEIVDALPTGHPEIDNPV